MSNSQISPSKRLQAYREQLGKSPAEVASLVGIPFPSYVDLEMHENELFDAISLRQLASLGNALNFKVPELFKNESALTGDSITFTQLADKIRRFVISHSISIQEFEDRAGWGVEKALEQPEEFLNLNLTGLKDICRELQVNWLSVLNALET